MVDGVILEAIRKAHELTRLPDATRLMIAIGLQESGLKDRYQLLSSGSGLKGPARGLWQFEKNGGVRGVMAHKDTRQKSFNVCKERGVPFEADAIWKQLEYDDVLAACFARLLLWTDPHELPDDEDGAWECYLRTWRPGRPHRSRWTDNWAKSA